MHSHETHSALTQEAVILAALIHGFFLNSLHKNVKDTHKLSEIGEGETRRERDCVCVCV